MKFFPTTYRTTLKTIAILSLISLGSAYVAEYVFGFKPCKLCSYQRIPYFLLIVIASAGWTINKEHLSKTLNYVCGGIFFIGFLIASYHVAVEHGIILENCSITDTALDLNALKNLILNHTLSCRDVPFRILGLSMAEINAVFSLSLAVSIFYNTKLLSKK